MTEKKENNYWISIIGLIAVGLILYSWHYTYNKLESLPFDERGTFGDMFGSINALYSGLAFAGIIFTILLQRKELKYQREELRETRKEFEIQNKTLKLQRFENTFFNLLSLHHQIVDSIDLDIEKERRIDGLTLTQQFTEPRHFDRVTLKGRDVFKEQYEKLVSTFNEEEDINLTYLKFYETVQTDFGHYFRNLYRIIKLVDETEFHTHSELGTSKEAVKYKDMISYTLPNFNTRYKYTSMIRSQLSDYELLWLFYNCLSKNGVEKFRPYIEQYSLLKNIPKDKLHNNKIADDYKDSAFKTNNCA
jgi:hypothetical protein